MTIELNFDHISIAQLQAAGSAKWSTHPGTIGAFVAEMDFGTAPVVTKALHEAVDAAVFGYLPTELTDGLSEAAARWYRECCGWDVSAAQVKPVADVLEGLELAIEHYSKPDAPVILPTPAYMPFLRVPRDLGREIITVPSHVDEHGRYTLDLDGIDAAFKAGGNLLILCNPYNPVGRVLTRDELEAVSQVVDRNGGRVFSDEIHAPLVYAGAKHIPYASISDTAAAHTLTAVSASKAWNLPGLKTAQVVLNARDLGEWERVGRSAEHGASTLGVVANTVAFNQGRDWQAGVLDYLDGNRRFLAEMLQQHVPEIRYSIPEGTYIAWLDPRPLGLGDSPAEFFREQAKVALTEGTDCDASGFVRFIFATPRPVIEQAVLQMAEALRTR